MVRLGMPLVDDYLEFLEGRCRPNTVVVAAYDLKLFFTIVAKDPPKVVPADVLGFITAQRTGRVDAGLVPAVAGTVSRRGSRQARSLGGCRASRDSSDTCRSGGTWPATRCRGDCPRVVSGLVLGRVCRWRGGCGGCLGS